MHVRRAVPLLLLLLASPAAAAGPSLELGAGYAWLSRSPADAPATAQGVALELRLGGRAAPRVGYGVTFTWGLTDWDRAGQYIDAGNRAGSWTTDRFADVEAWIRRGEDDDTVALRLFGGLFADAFLALSYAAVPICYVGSVGGATSHLQLDATVSAHLGDGPTDGWVELGAGAAVLTENTPDWSTVAGPVAALGVRLGPLGVRGRILWSPAPLNGARYGGAVLVGAVTASVAR